MFRDKLNAALEKALEEEKQPVKWVFSISGNEQFLTEQAEGQTSVSFDEYSTVTQAFRGYPCTVDDQLQGDSFELICMN
ncbi:hypothetical protein N9B69_00265 [Amylibacter sp.]|nr:hypothetical protein [Amylibacter sp.]